MKKVLMFAALIGSVVMGAAELDLSMYKPVDPARNMAKNGGFEMFSPGKKFMYYWGRTSDFFIWDTTVKHSGKASAKLGIVSNGLKALLGDRQCAKELHLYGNESGQDRRS